MSDLVPKDPAPVDHASEAKALDRHLCRACGYIYEPKKGIPQRDVPPGTSFDDLSLNWRCPVCSASKSQFRNIGQDEVSGFQENMGYGLGVNTLTSAQKSLLIFGGLAIGVLFLLSFYGIQ